MKKRKTNEKWVPSRCCFAAAVWCLPFLLIAAAICFRSRRGCFGNTPALHNVYHTYLKSSTSTLFQPNERVVSSGAADTKNEKNEQVLLQDGGANNIFSGLTRGQFRESRHTIVQAILGTDMSSHMEQCADVFQFAQKARRQGADEHRVGTGGGLARPAAGPARRAGGALDRGTVPPTPPPPGIVFCADKAEDRCFLTKTITHWCVRALVAVTAVQSSLALPAASHPSPHYSFSSIVQ